jgi:hypothetical protein
MEDVLDVYSRPYDPDRPVICFDEKSKELRGIPRGTLPVKKSKPAREDYEYTRHGTANIFVWVEPLVGRSKATVTERRTCSDFAEQIKALVDEDYPDAERIVLVLDNLNTHTPGALYERYSPEEAHRINNRIEWHYTPEHASWLNIAEIELSILSRQCLARHINDINDLKNDLTAWQLKRNKDKKPVNWQFTTKDARIKLRRLYPKLAESRLA